MKQLSDLNSETTTTENAVLVTNAASDVDRHFWIKDPALKIIHNRDTTNDALGEKNDNHKTTEPITKLETSEPMLTELINTT